MLTRQQRSVTRVLGRATLVACVLFLLSSFAPVATAASTNATWTGQSLTDDNWGTTANWSGGGNPDGAGSSIVHFAGSARLTPNNNYGGFTQFNQLFFESAASSFTLGGNAIKVTGKIENNSNVLQTYNMGGLSLTGQNGGINSGTNGISELDPSSGDLTINNSIFLDDNVEVDVFGSHVLTLNGAMQNGNNAGKLVIKGSATVVFNGANTYTAGTFVNNGQLKFGTGSASGTLTLGDTSTGNSASIAIGSTTGGTSVGNAISVRSGSTGTKSLVGLNTSGTNTYSGVVTISTGTGAGLSASSAGGILDLSNRVLSGTPGTAVALTVTAGTVTLSGSTDNTDLGVVVNNGATLILNKTSSSSVHAFGTASTINSGGTLQLSGSNNDQIYTAASLANNGTFDLAGKSEGFNVMTGGGAVTNSAASTTSVLTLGESNGSGSFTGALQDGGSGKVLGLVKTGTGVLTLNNAGSNYTGGVTVSGGGTVSGGIFPGQLVINNESDLGAVPASPNASAVSINGATLAIATGVTISANRGITVGSNGGAISDLQAAGTQNVVISSPVVNNSAGNHLFLESSDATTFNGVMSGTGDIVKEGAGTAAFNNTNTFQGAALTGQIYSTANMYVDSGTAQTSTATGFGTTGGNTSGGIGLGPQFNNGQAGNATLAITGNVTVANPIDVRFFTGVTGFTKTIAANDATSLDTPTFSGTITLHDSLILSAQNAAPLTVSGAIVTGTATSGNSLGSATEAVNGTPGVTINSPGGGAGAVIFTGSSSYGGGTAINAGTLLVNNTSGTSGLGTGTVNINSSGKLGGTGNATASAVQVNSGGTITPGGLSPDATPLRTGSETWNTGGTLAVRLDSTSGANHDTLVMSGLTFPGSSFAIQLVGSGTLPTLGTSWIIAAVNGGNSNTFDSGVISKFVLSVTGMGAATPSNFTFSEATDIGFGGGEDLIVTYSSNAAPEPTSFFLFGSAVMPLLLNRRRRNPRDEQSDASVAI